MGTLCNVIVLFQSPISILLPVNFDKGVVHASGYVSYESDIMS